MDIQKEWGLFVAHLRTLGVVKIGRNALGVITNLTREGNCSLGYNDIELMWEIWQAAKAVPDTQALHDRLLVKSIREHVESHVEQIIVADLFDKGWLAAMKCIQNNIDMLEAQEQSHENG